MATKTMAAGKRNARLDLRRIVQGSVHGREIDPDLVQPTLVVNGKSYDDLEEMMEKLETCVTESAAFEGKGYDAKIAELAQVRAEAVLMRKELDAEQLALNERFKTLREMEERGRHGLTLQTACDNERREMMNRRRQMLGTTDLTEFPSLD